MPEPKVVLVILRENISYSVTGKLPTLSGSLTVSKMLPSDKLVPPMVVSVSISSIAQIFLSMPISSPLINTSILPVVVAPTLSGLNVMISLGSADPPSSC